MRSASRILCGKRQSEWCIGGSSRWGGCNITLVSKYLMVWNWLKCLVEWSPVFWARQRTLVFLKTRDCVAFWATPYFYSGTVCHKVGMKQGSRANFVLSSLYHKLRPQAFFLLNKLGFQLLPNATTALGRPAFWCVERLSVGPIPAADCSSFIVGSVSVMPYCSSDMLVRFTAGRIYLSWWRTWSVSSSTRGLFFEGAQCIARTQTHAASYVRCLWFESLSWVWQS